ncbi:hypothetical protein MB27_27515 [Actinoplanes utahensis]|uniref:Uncharacterized protein n=1 Tax=Actinoplanes utahensis TaxID=1869 RepID=A0A0A6UGR6_ACTUT|nr:hypothetical protein MB27_27515 [Actinoplanes utahensis]
MIRTMSCPPSPDTATTSVASTFRVKPEKNKPVTPVAPATTRTRTISTTRTATARVPSQTAATSATPARIGATIGKTSPSVKASTR